MYIVALRPRPTASFPPFPSCCSLLESVELREQEGDALTLRLDSAWKRFQLLLLLLPRNVSPCRMDTVMCVGTHICLRKKRE